MEYKTKVEKRDSSEVKVSQICTLGLYLSKCTELYSTAVGYTIYCVSYWSLYRAVKWKMRAINHKDKEVTAARHGEMYLNCTSL